MAFIIKDRVKESTTSTGTGAITLSGAAATFDTFQSYMTNGDTTYYAIVHTTSGVDEWEVGLGTWNTGNTLTRTTVLAGSNGTSAQDFAAGNKDVFMTYPAAHAALAEDDVTFDNITVTGTVDGRDVAADGTKLDTVEQNADVTDAVNVAAAGALMRAGGTMTGNLILNADPGAALGAATKQYVDTIASAGIHYHTPVRAEHPSNLNATYSNGSSGVGATLTNAGTNAALVIDSVSMVLNDRVLVANQTTQTQNGVYTVTTVGDGSTAWVLTRSTDTDTAAPSDPDAFGKGDAFFIKEGVTNAGHLDVLSTSGTIVFGTTNIVFSEVAETTVYSGGTGITLTGTTFAIGQDVGTTSNVTFNQVTAAIIGNVTGDVTGDVTGNAATATTLETSRTIQLTGDVTGSATFDGSANASITAVVQDDSHSHVISNVDGLQTALDAKAPTSRTITAGNGLTGGGDLTANRTLTVGGGTGITVNANDIAIDSSYTGFDSRYVNTAGDTMSGALTVSSSGSGRNITLKDSDSSGTAATPWLQFKDSGNTDLGYVGLGSSSSHDILLYTNNGNPVIGGNSSSVAKFYKGGTYYNIFHDDYHPNADKWTLARTLTLSGDASGSVSWDGSANATLSVAVVNDSHTHDTRYIQEGGTDFSGTYPIYFRTAARQAYSNGGITFTGSTDTLNVSGNINVSGDYVQIGPSNQSQYLYLGGSGGSSGANTAAISVTNGNLHMDSATTDSMYLNYYTGNGVAFGGGSSNVVAWMGSDGDLWKGSSDNSGSKYWHAGNDGSGSGLDADTVDGIQASSFLRSDADDNVTGHTEWQDNYEIRLGNSADFRMYFNGTDTFFRNYAHANGDVYFQGENSSGTNGNAIKLDFSGTASHVELYQNGTKRLQTVSGGVGVTGLTVGDVDASPHNANALEIAGTAAEKIVLSGASTPYIRWQEGTTDKAYIQWNTDGYLLFRNQESGNFRFRPNSTSNVIRLSLEASDGDVYGSVYGTHGNEIGFLDDDGSWAYRHQTDNLHEWRINNSPKLTLTSSELKLDCGTSSTLSVKCDDDGRALIRANGDNQGTGAIEVGQSDTYGGGISYNGDGTPSFVSGETADYITFYRLSAGTRTEVISYAHNSNSVYFNGDLHVPNKIFHSGDTNTYTEFHASDQWRVVVGGSERLEVKNSSPHVLVSGDLNSTSDERLKKNIKPIDNALADICQLEGVTFDWKDSGTQGQGFIAQQVEPIIPDVVNTDEETGMKSVNYVGLIGHLVEAIKEQQVQIDGLKAQLNS